MQAVSCTPFFVSIFTRYNIIKKMSKLKKVIVEIDGKETEYSSLSECAKALGVSVAAVSVCASSGWLCKGHVVRYAEPKVEAKPKATAEDVNKLIASWYTEEWREYVSSDALVSLIQYIKEHWN